MEVLDVFIVYVKRVEIQLWMNTYLRFSIASSTTCTIAIPVDSRSFIWSSLQLRKRWIRPHRKFKTKNIVRLQRGTYLLRTKHHLKTSRSFVLLFRLCKPTRSDSRDHKWILRKITSKNCPGERHSCKFKMLSSSTRCVLTRKILSKTIQLQRPIQYRFVTLPSRNIPQNFSSTIQNNNVCVDSISSRMSSNDANEKLKADNKRIGEKESNSSTNYTKSAVEFIVSEDEEKVKTKMSDDELRSRIDDFQVWTLFILYMNHSNFSKGASLFGLTLFMH